jgi:hypothetical protein
MLLQQDELWVEGAVGGGRRVVVKPLRRTACPTVQLPDCMPNRFAVGQACRLSLARTTDRLEQGEAGRSKAQQVAGRRSSEEWYGGASSSGMGGLKAQRFS